MSSARVALLAVAVAVAPPAAASAEPLAATSDAGVLPRGSVVVGLLSPTRVGLDGMLELSTQLGWWALLSPHLELRIAHLDGDRLRLTSSIGLWTPTPAMRLLKGYLFPEWERSDDDVGWFVVPELGVAASTGRRLMLTGQVRAAAGLGVGENAARSLDTFAPVELVFAPALNGHRVTASVIADGGVLRWLRLRLELALHHTGAGEPPRSPWMFQLSAAVDVALGRRVRLSAGLSYHNYDQRAEEVVRRADGRWERRGMRSNDVFPTLDLAWTR